MEKKLKNRKMIKKVVLIVVVFGVTTVTKAQNWNPTGDNTSTGNLYIGATSSNSYSKIVLKGPNQPANYDSKRDLSFEFASAGSAILRAYRGGSWNTSMQFLTTPISGGNPLTRMHINHNGFIGIGTAEPSSNLEVKTSLSSPSIYEIQKWTNTHHSGYNLSLKTIWDTSGINHSFIQKFNGTDYNSLSFFAGKIGIGTTTPSSKLEVKTPMSSSGTYDTQKWTNTHHSGYNLSLKTIWDTSGINHSFVHKFNGTDYNSLSFYAGKIGIGTTKPDMKLTVNGNIHAKEVKIDLNIPAPDYVFKENYQLRNIEEVERFIKENSHLPEIPSAKEFEQNGVMLAEMDMNLLKKIEELTLYTIQQEKKLKSQDSKIEKLEKKNEQLTLLNKKLLELQSRLEKLESKK